MICNGLNKHQLIYVDDQIDGMDIVGLKKLSPWRTVKY